MNDARPRTALGDRRIDRDRPRDGAGARPRGLRSRRRRPRRQLAGRCGQDAPGRKVVPIALELRSENSIERAVTQAAAALGAIDLLVNNAGRPLQKPATDVTWAEWDDVIDINLKGSLFLAPPSRGSAAIAGARRRRGQPGLDPRPHRYCGPFGLRHLQRRHRPNDPHARDRVGTARHSRQRGRTGYRAHAVTREAAQRSQAARACWRAFRSALVPTMDEVAAAICYLASDAAAAATGQIWVLDGGLTAA